MRVRRRDKGNGLTDSPYLAEALQVAYYHCILEMPLKDIAELLGKSPATITRRLDEVRQAGWVRDHPEFNPPAEVWKELQGRMTCSDVESALRDYFGSDLLRRVTVLPSPIRGARQSTEASPEQVARVGLFAAQRLHETLAEGPHVVGINWGWSVRQCVMNLRPAKTNPDLRFVPLIGNLSLDENDLHFEEAIDCSSNRLAQMAASAFGAPRAPRLSTPAYIPRRFSEDRRGLRAIRDFIESDVSFRRIFGGTDESGVRQPGLTSEMDTLITGLSSIDVETLPIYRPGLITPDDLALLQRAGVVGDLALHLLVEEAVTERGEAERALVDSINALIVGASPEDFVSIAERSRGDGSRGLGVVVLAVGAWKASILTTAIRLGAVNELITDLETALAIGRHVGVRLTDSARLSSLKR